MRSSRDRESRASFQRRHPCFPQLQQTLGSSAPRSPLERIVIQDSLPCENRHDFHEQCKSEIKRIVVRTLRNVIGRAAAKKLPKLRFEETGELFKIDLVGKVVLNEIDNPQLAIDIRLVVEPCTQADPPRKPDG